MTSSVFLLRRFYSSAISEFPPAWKINFRLEVDFPNHINVYQRISVYIRYGATSLNLGIKVLVLTVFCSESVLPWLSVTRRITIWVPAVENLVKRFWREEKEGLALVKVQFQKLMLPPWEGVERSFSQNWEFGVGSREEQSSV